MHADEADVGCVEEFEVSEHGFHASCRVVSGDAHLVVHCDGAFDLAGAVFAFEFSGIVVVGVLGYATHDGVDDLLADIVACFAGCDVDEPRLYVAV